MPRHARHPSSPHQPAHWRAFLSRCLLAISLSVAIPVISAIPSTALAQTQKIIEPAELIELARKEMDGVRQTLRDEGAEDAALIVARQRALDAQTQAEDAAGTLADELAEVQARLAELGAPAAGVKEPADIAAQRAQLVKSQSTLDSQVKLARLLSVEAEQAATSVSAQRRAQFSAQMFARASAITSATFWRELKAELPGDWRRLNLLLQDMRDRVEAVAMGVWLAAAFAIGILLLVRRPFENFMLALILKRVPAGRLRRSLHAVGVMLVWTLVPGLIAHALYLALTSEAAAAGGSMEIAALLISFDGIVWFGGFCAGLGIALLMPGKPSWRLPPVSDITASRLRWFPPALAFGIVLGWVSTQLSTAADASLAATVAVKTLASLTLLLLMMGALVQLRRSSRDRKRAELIEEAEKAEKAEKAGHSGHASQTPPTPGEPLWLPTMVTIAWLLVIATFVGLLSGYVALGNFVMNQVVWALIVSSLVYLLLMLIDDLFMGLLAPTEPPASTSDKSSDKQTQGIKTIAPHRTREQTAVLLSGITRVTLVVVALVLLVAPFGEGPLELFRRAGRLNEGLSIGEIHLLPATLLQGLAVLVIGLFLVRALKNWLGESLMPTTRMDSGMRMSVVTLFGYVGGIAVVALSMSAVGVGLERVAWVASALSVGIGFGLQAVVQNFVSGLILLAERPVKVGDWVSLAGVEGDIRRINVRATEIQMGDRSTVIVPNSEFITKIVRNVTYTDPIGMVQIKLPMPLATDTQKARDVLLQAFMAHPGVLENPRPNVQLDGIDGLHLVFNATGFVSSPRASYGVKSDLLFDVMERLKQAGLTLAQPPTMVMSPAAVVPQVEGPQPAGPMMS